MSPKEGSREANHTNRPARQQSSVADSDSKKHASESTSVAGGNNNNVTATTFHSFHRTWTTSYQQPTASMTGLSPMDRWKRESMQEQMWHPVDGVYASEKGRPGGSDQPGFQQMHGEQGQWSAYGDAGAEGDGDQ